jgi:outer membrane protein OmpA-like peptidoglycan-associated protein
MSLTFYRLLALVTFFVGAAQAQTLPDAPGAQDHPAITRYAGSWLVAQDSRAFDQVALPAGNAAETVEGRVTRLFYVGPAGKSVLEVQRNYEQALEAAGGTRRDACADDACGRRNFKPLRDLMADPKLPKAQLEGWSPITLLQQWQEAGTERYWYGTVTTPGGTLHVAVLTAKPGTIALSSKYAATVIEIVEPKAMEGGKVAVDAGALKKGLEAEGKVALYGLTFDTGKATIKPESAEQLAQMAQVLKANAQLKVYIVGHTDNQGALESNLSLSKARAQAVVDALAGTHGIDARRLSAAGVANWAPVASNAAEAGRARNRRVEMVVQ